MVKLKPNLELNWTWTSEVWVDFVLQSHNNNNNPHLISIYRKGLQVYDLESVKVWVLKNSRSCRSFLSSRIRWGFLLFLLWHWKTKSTPTLTSSSLFSWVPSQVGVWQQLQLWPVQVRSVEFQIRFEFDNKNKSESHYRSERNQVFFKKW